MPCGSSEPQGMGECCGAGLQHCPSPRFRPGAGGGAAAVRAQTEMEIPQKFPARALPGAENLSTFLDIPLRRKVVCA